MVGAHYFHPTARLSPDPLRPSDLVVLFVDRCFLSSFPGAPREYREDPDSVSHLPVLSDSGGRHETNPGHAGCVDDLVGCGGDNL